MPGGNSRWSEGRESSAAGTYETDPGASWRELETGELRLMHAVLADAIMCLLGRTRGHCTSARAAREAAEAHEWIQRHDRDWPFSFERICEALDLDAATLRRRLLEAGAGDESSRSRRVVEAAIAEHIRLKAGQRLPRRHKSALHRTPPAPMEAVLQPTGLAASA